MSQMLLQSPESFTPHDDFVGIILKFTVCCSHCLKAPQNSFLINGYRAKKEEEEEKSIYRINFVQNIDHSNK